MARQILVTQEGKKEFKITVPEEARLTFGPWSPSSMKNADRYSGDKALTGTLRVYAGKSETSGVIAVFSGVTGYRDLSLIDYSEKTTIETGSAIWKSDKQGYYEEKKVAFDEKWDAPQLTDGDVDNPGKRPIGVDNVEGGE